MSLTLGVLAGEASGDRLGAGMLRELRALHPDIRFIGVGGPLMEAQGLTPLASMDELSVNGLTEPIVALPRLLKLLRRLLVELPEASVDGFVGIDFNVFNFILEKRLRGRGIKTAHYVSPSVYAWRRGRTKRVARCAELLLCLYPFEPDFYAGLGVRTEFVGHPLADEIDMEAGETPAQHTARVALGIDASDGPVLAVLPGSRQAEVRLMAGDFLEAAARFASRFPGTQVVIPCLRPQLRPYLEAAVEAQRSLAVTLYDGDARQALTSCDIALVKSGTSTLEAMLLHRPMVVSYRMNPLASQILRRLIRSPYVALPNILSARELVPELLQEQATAVALAEALARQYERFRTDPGPLKEAFASLHSTLRRNADAQAARSVLGFLSE